MRLWFILSTVAGVIIALSSSAWTEDSDAVVGRELAVINCAECHAIAMEGDSPFAPAPPFRDIAQGYDATDLEDAFMDGLPTTHPAMPAWKMTPDQAREIAAYIMSLQSQ